jgi:hypothetical protein
MSDRQSIIGFTEAELGFFLALLCLILFVIAAAKPNPPPQPPEPKGAVIPQDSLDRLLHELHASAQRIATLEATIDTLRDRRSRITPSCSEKGIASGPLFTVAVISPNRFRLDGAPVSIEEILARTQAERAAAKRAGCVHAVRVAYLSSLSASQLDAGWKLLDPEFRLIRAGAVGQ